MCVRTNLNNTDYYTRSVATRAVNGQFSGPYSTLQPAEI